MWLGARTPGIDRVAFPSGELAIQEERSRQHGGLYWVDTVLPDGEGTRLYLPNFFNVFRESLRADGTDRPLIGDAGVGVEQMGEADDANRHYSEAEEFVEG